MPKSVPYVLSTLGPHINPRADMWSLGLRGHMIWIFACNILYVIHASNFLVLSVPASKTISLISYKANGEYQCFCCSQEQSIYL